MQHRVFIALFLTAVSVFRVQASVFILAYHTFLGNGKSSMDFSPPEFQAQLERFSRLGYRWLSLDDAVSGNYSGTKNLVLTIDDGNHSVPAVVFDAILPRGIVPALFVSSGLVGHSRFVFSKETLKSLSDARCIVGAHGYTHQYLTPAAFKSEPKRSRAEILNPGPWIESLLGKRALYFAYPFGIGSSEAKTLVAVAGYRYAFLADAGLHPVRFDDPSLDSFGVPRTIMYRWNVEAVFRELERRAR